MAFETGNPQFDFLLSRARNRRRAKKSLEENNIEVQTTKEKIEESESGDTTTVGSQVADISGLGASGVSVTGVSQSIADAQEMMDIAGVGTGQTVGQVAFETEQDRAKAEFAQSNPVGAAIAGISTDAVVQGAIQTAPLGLAMAGQMEAARAAANIGSVISGPVFGAISGVIGPTMQDPYGQNVAMGSGLLGQVSNSLMSTHYSVAEQVAKGTPGYAQGYYGGSLVSVEPGIFGGLTYSGVNVPDIHTLSPTEFMDMIEEEKAYGKSVEPFGGIGATSVISDPSTISVDTFDTPTQAAQAGVGYSSYSPTGQPTGAAPAGSQYSVTGVFSTGNDDNNTSTSSGSLGTTDVSTSGLGSIDDSYGYGGNNDNNDSDSSSSDSGADTMGGEDVAYGGKIGMQMGGDPAKQQTPTGEMGFVGGPPDQFSEQQTIADDIPKKVPEGAFVINAPAVEFAGKEDIKQMLVEAYELTAQADIDAGVAKSPKATKVPSKQQVDIMISRGEVIVPPEIAKIIGYDRLEKINNRGKREVARRQEESEQDEKPQARQVAEGGAITTIDDVDFKRFYPSPEEARKVIDDISEKLPLADTLAILIEGEAEVLGDEGLEGAAHVLVNRANAEGYRDFGKSLGQELTKKTYGKNKIFQFNALEPTKFRKTLNKFKKDKDRYLKVRNIAEEVLAGAREDFTGGALFFKNPTSSEAKDFKKMVDSGELVETTRTVSSGNPNMMHIYFKPKDFGTTTKKQPNVNEGFISIPAETNNQQLAPRRPESRGGSFLFRGSDYERGGATPAF